MSQESSQLHVVAAVVDEGSNPFELACLIEVLGIDRPEAGGLLYDLRLCSRRPRVAMRQGLFTMTGIRTLSAVDEADTVIVPNRPDTTRPHHRDVLDALRRAHARGARIIGMCSGAFTLAEAGILDQRRATVHWQWVSEFASRYPAVRIDGTVLFVDDGDILTSAGSAAALDLALHLVRRDHGMQIGTAVSRRLVFPGHRRGGQQQFIERPMPAGPPNSLSHALVWAEQRATQPISVADIAARAAISPATLHRRFQSEMGCTPHQWLTTMRIDHARRLLEQTTLSVSQVARRSGLGSASNLRHLLASHTGLTPSAYRQSFGQPHPDGPRLEGATGRGPRPLPGVSRPPPTSQPPRGRRQHVVRHGPSSDGVATAGL